MPSVRLSELKLSFNTQLTGSMEKLVHGIWDLQVLRLLALDDEQLQLNREQINAVNRCLGVEIVEIDLRQMHAAYREGSFLTHAVEEESNAKWIWFYNIDALTDTNYAGWLRSTLTVRTIENLRCVFVVKNISTKSEVFDCQKAPLYQSTVPLFMDCMH